MTERLRSGGYDNSANVSPKMANGLSPRSTTVILVIVVGCFAVLIPQVFYPMLLGSATRHLKPSPIDKTTGIRQERPHHLRSEMVHPAFRERGRAIPHQQVASPSRPPPRMVEGRPGPIPGLRPTMGGAGHIVAPPKHSTGIVGLVMPFYTIAIVIFFTYTVMKLMFKKQPETLYPPTERDPTFRKEVFESERNQAAAKLTREGVSSKLGWKERDTRDAELDQLRRRLRETELAMERIVDQMAKVPLKLQDVVSNGTVVNQQDDEQASVKVLGMEMTASCEGGKKWSRPDSPVLPHSPPPASERVEPPQEIFLEGALPAQSQLLVADSATEAQRPTSEEDPAVVLAGKMTLSVISLDSSENGTDESSTICRKEERRTGSDVSEDFEKIEADVRLQDQIEDIIKQAQDLSGAGMKNEFNSEEVEVDKSEERHKTLDDISKEFLAEEVIANERELTPQLPESEITIEDDAETGTSVTEETPVTTEEAAEQLAMPAEAATKVETNKQPKSSASPLDLEISKEFLTDKVVANEQELTKGTRVPTEEAAEQLATPADAKVETNEQPEQPPASLASPLDLEIRRLEEQLLLTETEDGSASKPEVEEDVVLEDEATEDGFEKLNAAIEELSTELRPRRGEEDTVDVEDDEEDGEEEIEYEYEDSDNEEVDEEIRNVERIDLGAADGVNGEDLDPSKYGTASREAVVENEISDDEDLDDDEVEVEEIIEYVSDEEEEEPEEIVEPEQRNNVNHIAEEPDTDE